MLRLSLFIMTVITLCLSCADDDAAHSGEEGKIPARRTIIAYISGDNNLSQYLTSDIGEMVTGSKNLPADCNLIVFADLGYGRPYIAEISSGKKTMLREYYDEFYCINPDTMRHIMQWIANEYPAREYALLLSGHGTGIVNTSDTIPAERSMHTLSYGADTNGGQSGSLTKWINDSELIRVMQSLTDRDGMPLHFSYILFDCCCMQSVETAYALRHVTDCIIASPAETPGNGAPYDKLISSMCLPMDQAPEQIVKDYIRYSEDKNFGGTCLTAIRTSGMQALADATRTAFAEISRNSQSATPIELSTQSCIYYFVNQERTTIPVYHDIRNVMLRQMQTGLLSEETYRNVFLPALQQVIIYSAMPQDISATGLFDWSSAFIYSEGFQSFNVNSDTYCGISIAIPQKIYENIYSFRRFNVNSSLRRTEWYSAAGWDLLGW